MKSIDIKGTARTAFGKKNAKMLRKENLIPCNLYGVNRDEKGLPVATPFSVQVEEVRNLVYSPDIYVVNLTIDNNTVLAVMREIQFHAVKDNILHIDFYQVTEDKPIVMDVPLKLKGLAVGVKAGGKLQQIMRRVKVKALYNLIPEKIENDFYSCTLEPDGSIKSVALSDGKCISDGIFGKFQYEKFFDIEDACDEKLKALYLKLSDAKKAKDKVKAKSIKADIKAYEAKKADAKKASKAEMDKHAYFARAAKPYLDAEKLVRQEENYKHYDNFREDLINNLMPAMENKYSVALKISLKTH